MHGAAALLRGGEGQLPTRAETLETDLYAAQFQFATVVDLVVVLHDRVGVDRRS